VRWSHWLLSHAAAWQRDDQRLADLMPRVGTLPLGSGGFVLSLLLFLIATTAAAVLGGGMGRGFDGCLAGADGGSERQPRPLGSNPCRGFVIIASPSVWQIPDACGPPCRTAF
jgi:hypothetical protein